MFGTEIVEDDNHRLKTFHKCTAEADVSGGKSVEQCLVDNDYKVRYVLDKFDDKKSNSSGKKEVKHYELINPLIIVSIFVIGIIIGKKMS